MAALNAYTATLNGTAAAQIAATHPAGDSIPADGFTKLLVENPTGGAITITFDAPGVDNFGVTSNDFDKAISVPAGAWRWIGPFPTSRFADSGQRVQMTYSASGLLLHPLN